MLERSFAAETLPPGRLRRRVRRLLQMSPRELGHRAAERLRVEADRRRWTVRAGGMATARPAIAGGTFRARLRDTTAPRLFGSTSTTEALDASRATDLRREADALLAHRVPLLGFGEVDLGPAVDWHRDPVAGERWAVRFFADYDLVDGDGPDPKVVLELGRHRHVARLALAHHHLGDDRCAREAVAQLVSWVEQNPRAWGVHWSSSLDVAIRILAWLPTLALLSRSDAFTDTAAAAIATSLADQLDHVARYLSTYTSPNTHLLGEAAALFVAGSVAPYLPAADEWRLTGARILEHEIALQVGEDGVYAELSTYYHAYALDFYLLALAVGARTGHHFSVALRAHVGRMAEALDGLAGSDGRAPRIGDDDGGVAFPFGARDYYDARDLLSFAAAVLGRPELHRAGHDERALWLCGGDAIFARSADPPAARARTQVFPDAGWYTQSMDTSGGPARLLFDAGGMGLAGGGHSHADALQILLDVGDQPILVDPGTSVYNRAPAWRGHFRGTRAHNTVTVDGLDQCAPWGTFAWGSRLEVHGATSLRRSWCQYVEATHDGYTRLASPVRHRRRVLAVGREYWLVADILDGTGRHGCAWHYQLAPVADIVVGRGDVTRAHIRAGTAAVSLAIATSVAAETEVVLGATAPIGGWVSAGYGVREPAPLLRVACAGAAPIVALTVIRPDGGPLSLGVERREHLLRARIEHAAGVDLVTIVAEAADETPAFWLRCTDGGVTHALAAAPDGTVRALERRNGRLVPAE